MQAKKWFGFGIWMFMGILLLLPVSVKGKAVELPVITQWQDGYAYQDDGTKITGTWAYDSVNPAGKYVQFGEDGSVIQKTDDQKREKLEENYTGTEQIPAVIAIRAEVFEDFHGTISLVLEEKSGLQKKVQLSEQDFYSKNVAVNSGEYLIQSVKASENGENYVTQFSDQAVFIPAKDIRVMKVVVHKKLQDTKLGEKQETTNSEKKERDVSKEKMTGKEERKMPETGKKKIVFLFGGICVICAAGIILLRRKQNKFE